MTPTTIAHANVACARSLLGRLIGLGVDCVVVSSGARCAPLVLAVSEYDRPRVVAQPDERSAGFCALGAAMASGRPTVLVCTSGTAAANYLPALIEASHSHVPMIVLTADRPAALHDCGAPQTIDQENLYGRYAKVSVTLPLPSPDQPAIAARWADAAEHAYRESVTWPPGPVHCNVPFDEPLLPTPETIDPFIPPDPALPTAVTAAPRACEEDDVDKLRALMRSSERCLLVAGPLKSNRVDAIARLTSITGCPLVADIASQLRCSPYDGARVIATADLLVRNRAFASTAQPEVIIRFGGLPTSKRFNQWLGTCAPKAHVVVADSQPIADPFGQATAWISGCPNDFARRLVDGSDGWTAQSAYAAMWREADLRARRSLDQALGSQSCLFEGSIVAGVFTMLAPGSIVMLGNSMPIRWADSYVAHRAIEARVLFNRGANGIDGVVSTAVGAAVSARRRVVLVIGDVSLMHDVGGLHLLSRSDCDLTVVILNNDGGGIFSFLPLAAHDAMFEKLIAMAHGRSFGDLARYLGIAYSAPVTKDEFTRAFKASCAQPGSTLIEVRTDRRQTKLMSDAIAAEIAGMDVTGS